MAGYSYKLIRKLEEIHIREIAVDSRKLDDVFLMADFHFDHKNIIKYCNRPFADYEEMNRYMLVKYNSVVQPNSLFVFLGDMTFGRDTRGARYWLSQLRGDKIYLKGSHDEGIRPNSIGLDCRFVCDQLVLHTPGMDLLCIHEPERATRQDLWIIHGHHHNNSPVQYPFVHPQNRTMNLSAELVDYTPVPLSRILKEVEWVEHRPSSL